MTRVLLTSFEPFGGLDRNSSQEVGRAVADAGLPGVEITWLVLPVVARVCVEKAWAEARRLGPALVLCLGQAAGASAVRLEDRAININHFPIPDNAGNLPRLQWIVPGAPAAYRTTTRVDRVADDLRRAGIPVEHSFHAGTYVCNHLFYGLLHRAAGARADHQTGFIHLPLLRGQVHAGQKLPACDLATLAEGVRRAIACCVGRASSPLSPLGRGVGGEGAHRAVGKRGA